MHTIAMIGVGRAGGSIAAALPADKYRVVELVVRDRNARAAVVSGDQHVTLIEFDRLLSLAAETIIIATQDDRIDAVVGRLTSVEIAATCILHTSGSLSSLILAPLRSERRAVGSLHPLVSLSDPNLGAERLKGSFFCVEGDPAAVARAQAIAKDLGGRPFSIDPEKKPLYHAAAVLASGHFVALIENSLELLSKCGIDKGFGKEIVMPLVRSTLNNIETQPLPHALTGTFARADVETFERHLDALQKNGDKRVLEIYLVLGDAALDLALERGADPEAVAEIRKKIFVAKRISEC